MEDKDGFIFHEEIFCHEDLIKHSGVAGDLKGFRLS